MYADLGSEARGVRQGSASGGNGVLRWNFGMASVGTCQETFVGGNHFRWFVQNTRAAGTAIFLAASLEESLNLGHIVQSNGYDRGRDEIVQQATKAGGIEWGGHSYNATVAWVPAGALLNATSEGINHPEVALPNATAQDGRVAVLNVTSWLTNQKFAQCVCGLCSTDTRSPNGASTLRAPGADISLLGAFTLSLLSLS